MNLNTVTSVLRPGSADEITAWRDGYAWLAGGTWLFSEPQIATDTLIDLEQFRWPAIEIVPDGLDIAATLWDPNRIGICGCAICAHGKSTSRSSWAKRSVRIGRHDGV